MEGITIKGLSYVDLLKRIGIAETNKSRWDNYIDECYEYFIPEKRSHIHGHIIGQDNSRLYDSTAVDSISDYANRMEAQLVPSDKEWMVLESGSEIPEDKKVEIDQQLQTMTDILFNHINSSNFSSQINEAFLDLGISTGVIIVEEGDGIQSSLRFRSVPLNDVLLEKSESGMIDSVFRKIQITYGDIGSVLPYIVNQMSAEEQKKIEDKPTDMVEFYEGTYTHGNTKIVFVMSTKEEKILYEDVGSSSAWVVFRENTIPGETYGRGRAMRCIQDVKTLNVTMQYYIETCELLANPIYTAVDDGIINPSTIVVKPKTIIPMAQPGSIQPLPVSGDPRLNIDLINRLQDSVRRTMLSKPFGQIDETPVRTATEMSIRSADLAQTSGTAAGRIQVELLERIIKRCVHILTNVGKLPQLRVDGREVSIKFTSPSSKTQDKVDVAAIMQFMDMTQAMDPNMVSREIKMEDVPSYIANKLGVSASLVRSTIEKQQESEKQAKMREQAMAQQAQQAGAIKSAENQGQLPPPQVAQGAQNV